MSTALHDGAPRPDVVYRWDLDKTYLHTDFSTVQAAIDSVAVGSQRVIRLLSGTYNQAFSLNGKNVIDRAHLPGMPRRGPIAFQSHGCPVEFQNVFVRRLGRESSADERAALEPKR